MQPKWNEARNQWEGGENNAPLLTFNTYADLPDPTTVESGTEATVLSDPSDALNGQHIALGGALGEMALYWRAG